MRKKPIVGITIGDPSGVGPEIIAKAFTKKALYDVCSPLVIGTKEIVNEGIRVADVRLGAKGIGSVAEAKFEYGMVEVLNAGEFDLGAMEYGKVQPACGKIAGQSIELAIKLALKREIHAVVTAPIHKEAFNQAGFPYPGHTEMFAALTNTKNYSMILIHDNLRVAHVTTHVSMRQAVDLIKKDRVLKTIEVAHNACKSLGISSPRIGVAGLNAHASDGGMFGDEERLEITPAIEAARQIGIDATGPVPPDTLFPKARGGMFDAVVVMYHDQGHIPLKLVGFIYDDKTGSWGDVAGVNATFGLPIIRTSVDHGTAFGKAGKGTANATSLLNAVEIAVVLAKNMFPELK